MHVHVATHRLSPGSHVHACACCYSCTCMCMLLLTDYLQVHCTLHGEGEGEERERVKPHALVITHFAPHNTLQLQATGTCTVHVNERCRMKKERSKQGQTKNRAKQHSTPKAHFDQISTMQSTFTVHDIVKI